MYVNGSYQICCVMGYEIVVVSVGSFFSTVRHTICVGFTFTFGGELVLWMLDEDRFYYTVSSRIAWLIGYVG